MSTGFPLYREDFNTDLLFWVVGRRNYLNEMALQESENAHARPPIEPEISLVSSPATPARVGGYLGEAFGRGDGCRLAQEAAPRGAGITVMRVDERLEGVGERGRQAGQTHENVEEGGKHKKAKGDGRTDTKLHVELSNGG